MLHRDGGEVWSSRPWEDRCRIRFCCRFAISRDVTNRSLVDSVIVLDTGGEFDPSKALGAAWGCVRWICEVGWSSDDEKAAIELEALEGRDVTFFVRSFDFYFTRRKYGTMFGTMCSKIHSSLIPEASLTM